MVESTLEDKGYTADEISDMQIQKGLDDLQTTYEYQVQGKMPPEPESFTVPEQSWPVEHPELSGVMTALAIIVVARRYLFMRRLETK
jgi:hypothetical protein